jgi:hypothetical protein
VEHVAPLLQTVLWVCLIAGILLRFHKPLHALLSSLAKRVESGSTVKAGPFEIADLVRPQTAAEQSTRIAAEVRALSDVSVSVEPAEPPRRGQGLEDVALEFARIEDLAFRAIQSEVGETITRNAKIGESLQVDGLFWKEGRLTLVEVMYLPNSLHAKKFAVDAAARMQQAVSRESKLANVWPQLLIVLVYKNAGDLAAHQKDVEVNAAFGVLPVTLRQVTVADLSSQMLQQPQ